MRSTDALTTEHDPASVRALTLEQVALLVAAGLDPHHCTIFVQSQGPGAHGAALAAGGNGSGHSSGYIGAESAATTVCGHLR
jgi:hypothetical protein